jgi:MerR family copper efflux transcriptional regulator
MKIGQAATLSGLSIKTIRYYDQTKLISPQVNPRTGYRDYSDSDVAKLQFVGRARRFNFSIEECRELLGLYENKSRSSREVKALAERKISEIDIKLAELEKLKAQLSDVVTRCSGDDRPDCPILEALSG